MHPNAFFFQVSNATQTATATMWLNAKIANNSQYRKCFRTAAVHLQLWFMTEIFLNINYFNLSLLNVTRSSSASFQQHSCRRLSCDCPTLHVICAGCESELFLASLIPREGEESCFRHDCQVQFLLAHAAFVEHALIKAKIKRSNSWMGCWKIIYRQIKVACDHVRKPPSFWSMVLFNRNHFHSDIWKRRPVICCRLLLIPCTHSKVDNLNCSLQTPTTWFFLCDLWIYCV